MVVEKIQWHKFSAICISICPNFHSRRPAASINPLPITIPSLSHQLLVLILGLNCPSFSLILPPPNRSPFSLRPPIQVSNPRNKITTHGIYRAHRLHQAWPACGLLLDSKQPHARTVPYPYSAFLHYHFRGENKTPEQGLVPAQREGRPFK